MLLSDKIKKFSVEQAIDYRNRNPVKNLPKLLDWADTFCAGKFEGQPRHLARRRRDDAGQPPRRKRSKTRAKNAKNCVQRTQKHRLPVGRRCFFQPSPRGDGQGTQSAQGKASSALPVLRRVTAKRKNVHGRVLPCTFRVRWDFPGLALRRVSCAGRGPGSGCAAARGRGPGAGCRRHSPGRGSAAGCAGRRLRLP